MTAVYKNVLITKKCPIIIISVFDFYMLPLKPSSPTCFLILLLKEAFSSADETVFFEANEFVGLVTLSDPEGSSLSIPSVRLGDGWNYYFLQLF